MEVWERGNFSLNFEKSPNFGICTVRENCAEVCKLKSSFRRWTWSSWTKNSTKLRSQESRNVSGITGWLNFSVIVAFHPLRAKKRTNEVDSNVSIECPPKLSSKTFQYSIKSHFLPLNKTPQTFPFSPNRRNSLSLHLTDKNVRLKKIYIKQTILYLTFNDFSSIIF